MVERNLNDPVGLCLRLNEALRRQIKQAAEDSERSMNGEILYRLRQSLNGGWQGRVTRSREAGS